MPAKPRPGPLPASSPSPAPSTPASASQKSPVAITPPPLPPDVASKLWPADIKDRTLVALYHALSVVNNQALSAKELAVICREQGLHAMGGATPSGTVNTAVRQHCKRARDNSSPCLFSWIYLAGDQTDLRLIRSIGAEAHRIGPEPERTYHCKKGGITRRGVRLFFLSEWTGQQNPFEREGLFDVPVIYGAAATDMSADDGVGEHSHALETGANSSDELQIGDNVVPVSDTPFPALSPNEDMPQRPPYATHKFRSSAELIPATPARRRRSLTQDDSDSEQEVAATSAFDRLNLHNFTWDDPADEDEDEDDLETVLSTPRSTSIESDLFSSDDIMQPAALSLRASTSSSKEAGAAVDPATLIAYDQFSGLVVGSGERALDYERDGFPATSDIINSAIHRMSEFRIQRSSSVHRGDDDSNLVGGDSGAVSGLLTLPPVNTAIANFPGEHLHFDVVTATSPFTSTASNVSLDRTSPFTPSPIPGNWPTLIRSVSGDIDALADLDAQNGDQRRKHDEDVQELLVGPEGVELHELEEAWGGDALPIAVSPLAQQVRHSSGMCVPMHTPCPIGHPPGYSSVRQTRGIKRSASMSGLDDGRGTADTSTSASLARNAPGASSLELYLVPDFFSPSSAPLPLKEDAGAVPLTPTLEAPILIHTIEPVYPAIYATQVESLPVFATAFGNSPRLLRRIDNDYVNLTTLATLSQPPLFAEKLSVLLSSCRNSHTIPFPSSSCSSAGGLSGFWIPLADVQRLCAHGDLNIPACVGEQFLSDILPDLFPEGIAHASRAYKKAGVGMAGLGLHACPTPQPLYQPRAIVDDDVGFDRPPAKRKPGRPRRALTEESMSTLNRSKKIAHVSNGIRRASVPTTPARNATRASLRSSVRSAASAFAA